MQPTKRAGLGDSANAVGRIISVVGGSLFVIVGLIMIFVRRSLKAADGVRPSILRFLNKNPQFTRLRIEESKA